MKTKDRVVKAFDLGYRVLDNGDVVKCGKKRKLYYNKRNKYGKYYCFGIKIGVITYSVPVHLLMAYQKYGERYLTAQCVRHLNGNSLDNSIDNIEIGTFSDNMLDIPKEVRIRKSALANRKYNSDEIRIYRENGHSYKEIMERYGISSKGTISYIINKHLPMYI